MRIRYTKTSDAPKLTSAVIALGINGVTDKSTEAEKLAAINKLQDDTSSYALTETNIFLEELGNKILLQSVFRRMQFKDPYMKAFFMEGNQSSSAKEIIDNQLLTENEYDPNKRYPDKQETATVLRDVYYTQGRYYLTNTVKLAGVKAAFVSEQAYGEWLSKQVSLLQESLQVIMFEKLSAMLDTQVKNTITIPASADSWDKIFVAINSVAENMAIPTKKYNLGYADGATATAAKDSRTNVVDMKDLFMIGSTDVLNFLNGEVQTVKFNNAYFKIDKYKGYIRTNSDNSHVLLVASNAVEGYFRVNEMTTQQWAANMSVEYFLHYWYAFGAIRWANAVRIEFTTPK